MFSLLASWKIKSRTCQVIWGTTDEAASMRVFFEGSYSKCKGKPKVDRNTLRVQLNLK